MDYLRDKPYIEMASVTHQVLISGLTPSDPFFANVLLLAGFNGSNGATTYTAETGQVLTISGASTLSSTQVKFGTTSFACANTTTGVFPASANWDLSATNNTPFTIEWWQYIPDLVHTINTFQTGYNTNGFLIRCGDTTTMSLFWIDDASGSDSLTQASAGFLATQWQACCIEKNTSGAFNFYIDGTRVKTSTPANSTFKTSAFPLQIGPSISGLTGYMDELRISNIARYNAASYTVQTVPFPRS